MEKNVYCSVYVTAPNLEIARKIAELVVEQRLAACANILPAVESVYRWDGKVVTDHEVVLFLKTTFERFDELKSAICALHPYEVPCIVALPLVDGYAPYLNWVSACVREDG